MARPASSSRPLLNLALVRWHGVFQQVEATWLRWAAVDGSVFHPQEEMLAVTRQQEEMEAERAAAAVQRAEAVEAEVARLQALIAQHAAHQGRSGQQDSMAGHAPSTRHALCFSTQEECAHRVGLV